MVFERRSFFMFFEKELFIFNRNPLNVSDLYNQRGTKRMYILKKCI